MDRAEGWFMCRIGFVETVRAVGLVVGHTAARAVEREWPAFAIVEVDQRLVRDAAELAIERRLRSLDALHLAAALALPQDELLLATWDRRLHSAGTSEGIRLLPETLG
jgi:predicted nucleic acid-binding protein